MAEKNVLVLDGGGFRGAVTSQWLSLMHQENSFLDHLDLVVGVSTGSLIALGLAMGITQRSIVQVYLEGDDLLAPSRDGALDPLLSIPYRFSTHLLEERLVQLMKARGFPLGTSLADLKTPVIIVASKWCRFSQNWKPLLFTNQQVDAPPEVMVADAQEPILDVVLSTTAVPTYFPSHKGHIDGALFGNNPSAVVFPFLERLFNRGTRKNILSMGTATWRSASGDWEKVRLVLGVHPPTCPSSHYQGREDVSYFRFDVPFPGEMGSFDVERIGEIVSWGRDVPSNCPIEWDQLRQWIRNTWMRNT